jgi:hypothetical protein
MISLFSIFPDHSFSENVGQSHVSLPVAAAEGTCITQFCSWHWNAAAGERSILPFLLKTQQARIVPTGHATATTTATTTTTTTATTNILTAVATGKKDQASAWAWAWSKVDKRLA